MKLKRLQRMAAITMATVMLVSSGSSMPITAYEVNENLVNATNDNDNTVKVQTEKPVDELQKEDDGVLRVNVDDYGNFTAENLTELEAKAFSWDNALVYFVFTDRFKNGDTSNDHSYGRGLNQAGTAAQTGLDSSSNPGTFHGGDLKGLTEKVKDGYFTDLGVNAIWITAPYEQIHGFTSGHQKGDSGQAGEGGGFPYFSYHGYWALDFSNIDENMGDEADFEKFVDSCHERGIRVVMDVVLNHTGYITIKDALDLGMNDALNAGAEAYYFGDVDKLSGGKPESDTWYNLNSADWENKWWGSEFVRVNSEYKGYTYVQNGDGQIPTLCGLPDIKTESTTEIGIPNHLKKMWNESGRFAKESAELDDFFATSGLAKTPRNYVIKWLSDWVRDYGVDGFRCDTAKHVEPAAWKSLKEQCNIALNEWREKNKGKKAGASWTDDFWMTGEVWGHGVGKSSQYFDNGFDSVINFTFPKGGYSAATLEGTFSEYARAINTDPEFNVLSYISSHDDCLTRGDMIGAANALLLTPGGAQIYYGDETNRPLQWADFFTGGDYKDQRYRSDMNWGSIDTKVLSHWQKLGQFRNKHLSIGAGDHEKLDGAVYTFSRTYHLEEDDEDKVVVAIPGSAGTHTVSVGEVFEEEETITDFYSGQKYVVKNGEVSVTCGENGVILLEGSGIVKASVNSSPKAQTYKTDTFDITLKSNKATDTYYQINNGEKIPFTTGDKITIGGDTGYGEETVVKVTGVSEDDGSALEREVTYQRSEEPIVSGDFYVRINKAKYEAASGSTTVPKIWVYSADTAETPYSGATWDTRDSMTLEGDHYEYENAAVDGFPVRVIITDASGTWRTTAAMGIGKVVEGSVEYNTTTDTFDEIQIGEASRINIKYVELGTGTILKEIYRVGKAGKNYRTYAGEFEGYVLLDTPNNATGVFTEEVTEVIYTYSSNGTIITTPSPTPLVVTETPGPNVTETPEPNVTETPGPNVTETPGPNVTATPGPNVTETPGPNVTETPGPNVTETPGPNVTATPGPNVTATPGPNVTATPGPNVTESPGPNVTESPGPNVTESPRPNVTESPGPIVSPSPTPITPPKSTAVPKLSVKSYVLSQANVKLGRKVTIQATATGGAGNTKYKYYYVKDGKSTLMKDYSVSSTFNWKPASVGTYYVYIVAKDNKGNTATSMKKIIVEEQELAITRFQVTRKGVCKYSIKVKAIGGKGKLKYRLLYKKGSKGKLKVLKKYTTATSFNWKSAPRGTVRLYLQVMDKEETLLQKRLIVKVK